MALIGPLGPHDVCQVWESGRLVYFRADAATKVAVSARKD